jgi:Asp/Glu/hydantoin racemase
MQQIAIVSVTLNAATPLMATFNGAAADAAWTLRNYLDEGLQDVVQREGGVTARSVARLTRLVGAAVDDGADAILLSCTVFSPYLDLLQGLFSTPVVGADCAMLRQAAGLRKKTAILCTFPASVESSERLFRLESARYGATCDVTTILLSDAAAALKAGDRPGHDRIIAKRAIDLARDHEAIVLAQISMASAAGLLTDLAVPVLTSPDCAISALKKLLSAQTKQAASERQAST